MSRMGGKILVQMLLVYAVTFLFAAIIFFTREISTSSEVQPIKQTAMVLLAFGIATTVIIVLTRVLTSDRIWACVFALVSWSGISVIVQLVLPAALFPPPVAVFAGIGVAFFILMIRLWTQLVVIHNIVMMLTLVGVAAVLGQQLAPQTAVMVLLALALYDLVAVFATHHMITMAKTLIAHNVFLGILLPAQWKEWGDPLSLGELGRQVHVIGGGDIALPLVVALAVGNSAGVRAFAVIAIAVLVGVVVMHILHRVVARGRPIPALPPLAVAVLCGYGITLLI